MPIHHHPLTPTLTLNSPNPHHQNIILTPPRPSDATPTIPAFNQPSIYLHLTGPPFPYTQESFDSFFHDVLDRKARIAAAELWDARGAEENGGPRSWVEALPFPSIREVVGEGREERLIGQVEVRRRGFVTVLGEAEREGLVRANGKRRTGDPRVEWECPHDGLWTKRWISRLPHDYLSIHPPPKFTGTKSPLSKIEVKQNTHAQPINTPKSTSSPHSTTKLTSPSPHIVWLLPTHHNLGIMPAILQTLLSDFAIPYMNMHTLIGEYLEYNIASRRVFEKCGFGFEGVVEGVERVAEGKRGALAVFLERESEGGRDWGEKGRAWLEGGKVGVGSLRWVRGVGGDGEEEGDCVRRCVWMDSEE